jgi:hypothetical protein
MKTDPQMQPVKVPELSMFEVEFICRHDVGGVK